MPHFAMAAKIFDQGADDRAVDLAHLADGVPEAEHVAVDAVAQPTSFSNQFDSLGMAKTRSSWIQSGAIQDSRHSPWRLCWASFWASRRSDFRRMWLVSDGLITDGQPFHRQAQRHVILARRLAGIAKFVGGHVDAVIPAGHTGPMPGRCAARSTSAGTFRSIFSYSRTSGNQNADLEETQMAVDAHAVLIKL